MFIKCKVPFGNFKPGDQLEVDDGVVFDHLCFEQVVEVPAVTPVTIPTINATGEVA